LILIDLPEGLIQEITMFAEQQDTDFDSFILWAISEKIGELKHAWIVDSRKNPKMARPTRVEETRDAYI
jgi:hypothetical protein